MNKKKTLKDNDPLRDGVNRRQRLAETLQLAEVDIDGRSLEDLLDFAQQYATQIQYYDTNNLKNGTWEDFFEKPDDISWEDYFAQQPFNNKPYSALFYTFLQLFKHAQRSLNTLTKKNLDFYYNDVLQLQKRGYTPDKVNVIFGLAKNVDQYLLQAGTLLDAGKDDTGKPIYYKTDNDALITTAQVADLKTLYLDKGQVYAAPVANSADGLGAALPANQPQWPTFGNTTIPEATLGFAIASPLLFLAEGTRTITIELTLDKEGYLFNNETLKYLKNYLPEEALQELWELEDKRHYKEDGIEGEIKEKLNDIEPLLISFLQDKLANAFKIQLSGPKGWITATPETDFDRTKNVLTVTINLDPTDDAVVAADPAVLGNNFNTQWPVIKFSYDPDTQDPALAYEALKFLQLQEIDITVTVQGVQNLVVQNDQSQLNPNKPFNPFGSIPAIGSSCYVGSAEVFQKPLDSLDINIDWYKLPITDAENNISNLGDYYYPGYIEQNTGIFEKRRPSKKKPNPLSNSSFQATMDLLCNKNWISLSSDGTSYDLFDAGNALIPKTLSADTKPGGCLPDPTLQQGYTYNNTTQNGFLRLQLTAPTSPITAFGHSDYPNVYTTQSVSMSAAVNRKKDGSKHPLPNRPYTPAIQSLSINYSASGKIGWGTNAPETQAGQLFHIGPFGTAEAYPYTSEAHPDINSGDTVFLLPHYTDEGTLYIGLSDDLSPGQPLNILFQVAEGSEDPNCRVPWNAIQWSYLANDQWLPLVVLSDQTNQFQNSGIISFDIPETITDNNYLLPAGMYWLRASIRNNAAGVCEMISVQTQAVPASFTDNNNDTSHLQNPLPAKSITKLAQQNASIKTVSQPYASYGGKAAEKEPQFYARVRERLRHKKRAISAFDYERLVLEAFPDIFKVNCLNTTTGNNTTTPGAVSIVVIPSLINQKAVNPFQPMAGSGTLNAIQSYLASHCSPFVKLTVENPLYEQLQMNFKVAFKEGYDDGYYAQELNKAIKEYLSPWAYKRGRDIMFGGKIYKSAIQAFVEAQSYVDFTTDFKMYQITSTRRKPYDVEVDIKIGNKVDIEIEVDNAVDVAVASTPISILVSDEDHIISVLESGAYQCEGEADLGIGEMIVQVNFEVS